MKPLHFKIRSVPSSELSPSQSRSRKRQMPSNGHQDQPSKVQGQNQFNDFFKMFQSFIKNNEREEQTTQLVNRYDLEVRDREVIVQPPPISNERICQSQLKRWASKVMKTVSSAAFHYFSSNEMSFEQAKIYCSENILKNIVILGQKVTLTDKDFEVMDAHIKTKVLDYLSAKYPMTDSAQINKKLEETVREVDNIEALQNNYFANTDLIFQYRDDGNYNDLIMSMLNEIMELVDGQSGEEKTNYGDFREFISSLFEKVEDEDWVRSQGKDQAGKQLNLVNEGLNIPVQQTQGLKRPEERGQYKERLRKRNEEKERYRTQVKQYTSYLIGRKIPQYTPRYSEKEIKSMSMSIKSPSVLRILTKLCEELLDKFETNNYYSDRSESIKVQKGGQINSILPWMRKELDCHLREEGEDLRKYMNDLSENNYQMQGSLLEYELSRKNNGDEHVDQLQKISGKFSLKTVKNLHSHIISLLNRLIHGLMKVAKRVHDDNGLLQFSNWPSPVNLLTFKVGDLMRCKCSSHQKQILHIFKEMQRLSREEPQKLRIVRIKNRLRSGTNDILVNVKFKGKVMCEVQLAVKATTSNFIKCSNLFHHYFYELQRSYFGPLTELCSIWSSLDRKSQIYQQLIDAQDLCIEQNEHTCKKLSRHYEMVRYQKPFICGQCSRTYFHNNYLRNHSRCSLCGFFVCAKCKLSQESEQQLISSLIIDPKLRSLCVKRITGTDPLPELGVCVFLQSQLPKVQVFTHFVSQRNGKEYILSKTDGKIYQNQIIVTKKQQRIFRSKYALFQVSPSQDFSIIDKDQIRKGYLLPTMIKNNYQKEKESLSLMDQQLNTSECRKILDVGTQWQKGKVKNLFLADNLLNQIPFNPDEFSNLSWLTVNRNVLNTCSGLQKCNNLSDFFAIGCNFHEVPAQILELKNLKKLWLSTNSISKVPAQISNLTKLMSLEIDSNELQQLPEQLCECINLKILNVGKNNLKQLPDAIYKLQNLQILICNGNYLTALPDRIGQLKRLKELNPSYNIMMKSLPDSLENLHNLEVFDCSLTSITAISENIKNLTNLTTLKLTSCQSFTYLPSFTSLQRLQIIDFSNCKKLQVPENFGQLTHLKQINLYNCNLANMPQSFKKLRYLQNLDLSHNKLSQIDVELFTNFQKLLELKIRQNALRKFPNLSKCKKLIKINFNDNQILEIPNNYIQGLANMEQFKINSNKLKYFPLSILDLNNLKILQAQSNKMQGLVNEQDLYEQLQLRLSRPVWPKLISIGFYNNEFTVFPSIFLKCTKLQQLVISSNKITSLPVEIGNLVNIKIFNMNYNEIDKIPKEMAQMKQLKQIYLSQNKIRYIPKQLQQAHHLDTLYVDNNPIQSFQNLEWIIKKGISCNTLQTKINKVILQRRMKSQTLTQNDPSQSEINKKESFPNPTKVKEENL